MPIVSCPACAKKMRIAEGMESKRFRCPGCGTAVPGAAAVELSPATAPTAQAAKANPRQANPEIDRFTAFLRPPAADGELGRLGSYRILRVLGHGGMGVVFEAEDVKLKRPVALKVMLPEISTEGSSKKRFLREAEAVAQLSHPHVVRIYQVDEDRDAPFMAMEYLQGESLEDRLLRDATLPVTEALRIGREVAEALEAAHARGLIHRDVKPSNIWLEAPSGAVKLLDFGLVRPTSESTQLTKTGVVLGTPEYMSLEQARGNKVDSRTDLFSVGVLLYRMCTGQVPFRGKNAVALLTALATEQPQDPQILNFDLSPDASAFILKLLAKNPDDRVQTATEMIATLKALENGNELTPSGAAQQTAAKPAPKTGQKGLMIGAAAVLILAAVVGLLIWQFAT